jgi:hypothetical protein
MALNLQHQTAEDFALRFWRSTKAAFDAGDREKYHRRIWWLWTKIQSGDITTAQARTSYNTAFGLSLTVAQFNNLVTTRFIPIKDRYVAWLAEGMV